MIAGSRVSGAPLMMSLISDSSNNKLPLPKQAHCRIGSVHDSIKTDHCRIITILVDSSTAPNSVSTLRNPNPEPSDNHIDFVMAGHGHHSFNGPPKPPVAHVPRIYRFTATALGAGMWFFLMYRAKKDGAVLLGLKHPWDH
ncbi:hypothetical protein F53441_3383 [Fusarium austroafricanum]|uniref:NADH dehydrogenase [ubiquinone] 1 beta subcomplex subunit 2 n=1 Tax=Fusarium austroafricanum TaxID=2364996 RepID=A0A8H4KR10_9HYPO|nr:hypothetical protein F53441_3383 [Fusarium austroafricanum]